MIRGKNTNGSISRMGKEKDRRSYVTYDAGSWNGYDNSMFVDRNIYDSSEIGDGGYSKRDLKRGKYNDIISSYVSAQGRIRTYIGQRRGL